MTSIIIWQKEVSSSARKHSKSFVDACRWCQGPLGCSEDQESQRKRKWLFCSKHQELERKGKWLNLNAFFNSWKCLFWIFENILLLSLGSTYIQRGDHTEGYEMCGCVCGGGYCGEIRIRVETNTHPYEGKYCLPGAEKYALANTPNICWTARSIAQIEVLFPTLPEKFWWVFFWFTGP